MIQRKIMYRIIFHQVNLSQQQPAALRHYSASLSQTVFWTRVMNLSTDPTMAVSVLAALDAEASALCDSLKGVFSPMRDACHMSCTYVGYDVFQYTCINLFYNKSLGAAKTPGTSSSRCWTHVTLGVTLGVPSYPCCTVNAREIAWHDHTDCCTTHGSCWLRTRDDYYVVLQIQHKMHVDVLLLCL